MKSNKHIPVLFEETINYLDIKKDGIYVDCTFGRGGHSREILKNLSTKGKLIAIDRDQDALTYFKENFNDERIIFVSEKFSNIKKILENLNIKKVDGILYDLGVSSPQLDNQDRGFSYKGDSLLDMRMNQNDKLTASDILKNYSKEKLLYIFKKYGEIYNSQKVVEKIISIRDNIDFFTTSLFVDIIKNNIPKKELFGEKHPARKYFQALRIEVNSEFDEINKSINDAFNLLNTNGRIVTISFHSLEDKIIKNIIHEKTISKLPKELLINEKKEFKIIKTSYKPSDKEKESNNRSRSSRIRCVERL